MKILLTSNGLSNVSIANALEDLAGKPRHQIRVAFIPNAAFAFDEHVRESKNWLINDLYRVNEFCGHIDIVSLTDCTRAELIKRLEYADVIFVGGGNAFYLSYYMEKADLFNELPRLLESRVYVGISAGSIVATNTLGSSSGAIENPVKFLNHEYDELGSPGHSSTKAASLVNFAIRPHLNSESFPHVRPDLIKVAAEELKIPIYAIDDQSAVKVNGNKVEVVSEGQWHYFSV